jgi:putative holliday junction resolvase
LRYIAIDLGDKRTGLAIGDSVTRIATPMHVLEVPLAAHDGEDLLAAINAWIDSMVSRAQPCELVLGLPINMDGTEGKPAAKVRAFGQRLAQLTARTLHYQDERLTSVDADWSMARSGMTHKEKKQRRDALAAAAILRDFLAALNSPPNP